VACSDPRPLSRPPHAVSAVPDMVTAPTRRRPLTLPRVPIVSRCRSSVMRPIAVQAALPTWAGTLMSCPSTWKVPCQVASAGSSMTTSDTGGVAPGVRVALVQAVASSQRTRQDTGAMRRRVRIRGHERGRVIQVLSCM
jgi:hypothetical protein